MDKDIIVVELRGLLLAACDLEAAIRRLLAGELEIDSFTIALVVAAAREMQARAAKLEG